jgi:hypothetical protein
MALTPLAQSWLLQSAIIFLIIGSVAGMIVGALLLFGQGRLKILGNFLNHWVSTRRLDRPLEKRISLDPWFYRHSQLTGIVIVAGALFVLYYFSFALDRAQIAAGLAHRLAYPLALAEALLDALVLVALLGALGAVLTALFILFRPSLLRGFEGKANQWLSLRKSMKPLEVPRDNLDLYVEQHARQFGVFMILGGLYTLVLLLVWLGRQG